MAAACAGIIYFLTYVPYLYISIREEAAHVTIPGWAKGNVGQEFVAIQFESGKNSESTAFFRHRFAFIDDGVRNWRQIFGLLRNGRRRQSLAQYSRIAVGRRFVYVASRHRLDGRRHYILRRSRLVRWKCSSGTVRSTETVVFSAYVRLLDVEKLFRTKYRMRLFFIRVEKNVYSRRNGRIKHGRVDYLESKSDLKRLEKLSFWRKLTKLRLFLSFFWRFWSNEQNLGNFLVFDRKNKITTVFKMFSVFRSNQTN